jgi:hypothetical protein
VKLLIVILLALAGLLFSARAVAVRPTAASGLLTIFFFLTIISTVDYGMGML